MKVSIEVSETLKNLPIDQVQSLANIADGPNMKALETMCKTFMEGEKNYMFKFPATDPLRLALEREFSRGKVSFAGLFLLLVKHAGHELEKRVRSK